MKRLFSLFTVGFALALSGCIKATGPILSDSAPVLGSKLRLQTYSRSEGGAHNSQTGSFSWNGHLYVNVNPGGGMRAISGFTAHPFDGGDLLIQTVPAKPTDQTEFVIAHKLVEGVWQVLAIDDSDADEATRAAFCTKLTKTTCEIETREQLFAFARATAAQRKDDGGLAIRLRDSAEKPKRR